VAFRALGHRLLRRLDKIDGFLHVTARVIRRPRLRCVWFALLLRVSTSGATMVRRFLHVETRMFLHLGDKNVQELSRENDKFVRVVELGCELLVGFLVGKNVSLGRLVRLRQGGFVGLLRHLCRFGLVGLRFEVNKGRVGSYHIGKRVRGRI